MRNLNWLYPGLLVLATGCIGPATRPKPALLPDPPQHVLQQSFTPEVQREAGPGEAMLKVKDYWIQSHAPNALVLDHAVTITAGKREIHLPHGVLLLNGGSLAINGKFYTIYHSANDDPDYGVLYYFNPDMTLADFLYLKDRSTFPAGMQAITKVFPAPFRLAQAPPPSILRDLGYQDYEMVFDRLAADGIHVTYREFAADASAPTVQKELTFPADAEQIVCNGIQIQVQGCTERKLRFSVLAAP